MKTRSQLPSKELRDQNRMDMHGMPGCRVLGQEGKKGTRQIEITEKGTLSTLFR